MRRETSYEAKIPMETSQYISKTYKQTRAIEEDSMNSNIKDIWQHKAEQAIENEMWEEAIYAFAKVQEHDKKKISSHEIKSLFYYAANEAIKNNLRESANLHCKLLGLDPKNSEATRNFALVLRRLRHNAAAETFIKKYILIKPNCANGYNTYATILIDRGDWSGGVKALKDALKIDPLHAEANSNLANRYHISAMLDQAFIYSSRALKSNPKSAAILLDHLTHLRRTCKLEDIEKINWLQLVKSMPQSIVDSSFLQLLVVAESTEQQIELCKTLKKWGKWQTDNSGNEQLDGWINEPIDKTDQIRIGLISADFRNHSVARFIWPLFEHLNPKEYQLFCFSTYQEDDEWRKKFQSHSAGFFDVEKLSPKQLSRKIRESRVHILFDLTGFTAGSRTAALATRAAGIQVSWLGFPGTTGLPTMDYLFLDKYLSPINRELISENVLMTNGTTVCFTGLMEVPITKSIPEEKRGYITLGTLNNSYKITRSTVSRWSRVMQKLPNAKFLFIRREFESYFLRENILQAFESNKISRNRIYFYNNRKDGRHYLDCYNELDITLDTFPVTGGTTTTDALWMGVPVVGLEGENIHQRVCSAILHHAGHPEWIARTDDEFVDIAINLANDRDLRINLRKSLREQIKNSKLCNSEQFANDFKEAINKLRPNIRIYQPSSHND